MEALIRTRVAEQEEFQRMAFEPEMSLMRTRKEPCAQAPVGGSFGWLSSLLTGFFVLVMLAGCADGYIRSQAQDSLRQGQYEQALKELEAGVQRYPESATLRSGLIQARAEAQARLTSKALSLRAAGQIEEAQSVLRQALALDPLNERTQALLNDVEQDARSAKSLKQAQQFVEAKQADRALRLLEQALKDSPRHAGLLGLQRELLSQQRSQQVQALSGALAESRPISLDFREASLRTVLDVVTRHSGINFVLDKDVRADVRVTVLLRQAKVEDALDLITASNQLAKKVVDPRTIAIYPNTPEKQREYQEQMVRVFSLVSSDAKGAAAFLKAMLKIRDPFVDERSNMLALRDSPENIQLAERLIAVFDTPEPEVLLEVEVLEVSSTRLTELGVKIPSSFSFSPIPPAGATSITLGNIGNMGRNNVGISLGNVLINLRREVGDVATLANPKLRVRNKEKAKIMIGDKIPVIAATTGTGGFVAETVTYLDVGLKLDVEPVVYVDDEVAIKVGLEVSSLGTAIKTSSGSVAYQIGTRNASTLLRLQDGETQLLAGLISKDERSTASRVPGLGDLPVLGRLFSSQLDDGKRTELLLAITPRILRNVKHLNASESELWVGTDVNPKLRPVGGLQGLGAAPSGPAVATNAGAPSTEPSASLASAKPPVERKAMSIALRGPGQVKVGDSIEFEMNVADAALRGLTTEFQFSADKLSFVDAEEGAFFRKGEALTNLSKKVDGGRLTLGVLRNQASHAEGAGTVFKLKFKTLLPGRAELRLNSALPIALDANAAKPVLPEAATVEIQ